MKGIRAGLIPVLFLVFSCFYATATAPSAGFFLPDSVNEMTLKFKTVRGLIVLPVVINDSIEVNLILDTGCRNLILFGKRFTKLFRMSARKPVQFSGLGSGEPVTGTLSIGNTVSINEVLGEQIPIVVVSNSNVLGRYHNVHGVIGYDIFVKFEIELDVNRKTITFRKALTSRPPAGYSHVPLRIVDARPIMKSRVFMRRELPMDLDLMIDTGSSLGLLVKTTDLSALREYGNDRVLGIGFNGPISGYETFSERLLVPGLEIQGIPTGIVASPWHNNASIGMDVLKDYIVILNYCQAYACFKRNV